MKDYHEMAEDLFRRRDHYLAERKKKMNTILKTVSGMSCLCAAALFGIWVLNSVTPSEADYSANIIPIRLESQTEESLPSKENEIGKMTPEQKSLPETDTGITDMDLPVSVNPGEQAEKSSETEDNSPQSGSSDVPVSEQSPGSLQAVRANGDSSDFFGGSYTDSQGFLCILLTEDTPENRRTICQELNLKENDVIFRNADYTLAYLTELQTRISQGMVSKELDFVVVSALREDTNRIHLTVTTQDASRLEKLQVLDSLGGALEIEYTSGDGMIKNLVQPKTEPMTESITP